MDNEEKLLNELKHIKSREDINSGQHIKCYKSINLNI